MAEDSFAPQFCEIGANLLDPVFRGVYRGKLKHEDDFDDMLQRAKEVGLEEIMVTTGQLKEAEEALKVVDSYPQLYTTVGVHPTRAGEFEKGDPDKHVEKLMALVEAGKKSGKVVAVGECGLDFDRLMFCSKEVQVQCSCGFIGFHLLLKHLAPGHATVETL